MIVIYNSGFSQVKFFFNEKNHLKTLKGLDDRKNDWLLKKLNFHDKYISVDLQKKLDE